MDPVSYLETLIERHGEVLEHVPWSGEHERWLELLFCLAHRQRPREAALTRHTIGILNDLGLLSPSDLAAPDYATCQSGLLCHAVLTRYGLTATSATHVIATWCRAAVVVGETAGGKVQRILRTAGERLRTELAAVFSGIDLSPREINLAIGHWVQNVTSLPISLRDASLIAASEAQGFTLDALVGAADELNLNLAALDDLVDAATLHPDTPLAVELGGGQ
jgi:hypothetical protein